MLSHITSLMSKWTLLPISWMSRITVEDVHPPETPLPIPCIPYHGTFTPLENSETPNFLLYLEQTETPHT